MSEKNNNELESLKARVIELERQIMMAETCLKNTQLYARNGTIIRQFADTYFRGKTMQDISKARQS